MCEFEGKLLAWLDKELPSPDAIAVEQHVRECAECRFRSDAYQRVSTAFAAYREAASVRVLSEVPDPLAQLRQAVFGRWRAVWGASIHVPVPMIALAALVLAIGFWQWSRRVVVRESPPRVQVKTVRVEVPVVKKEVVTRLVYRDRNSRQADEDRELRPVAELRPRIIRSQQ